MEGTIAGFTNWMRAKFAVIASLFKRKTPKPPIPIPPPPDIARSLKQQEIKPPPPGTFDIKRPPPEPAPRPAPPPVIELPPPPEPEPPKPEPPPVKPDPEGTSRINRKERRRLEKLRRKHDKFVTPQGPQPVHHAREPAEPKPSKRPAPEPEGIKSIPDGRFLVADQHHEDREGPDVLYEETEFYGEFNFRDTILQQLERYHVYIDRMKKRDHDSYEFYRQVGATVVTYVANHSHYRHERDDEEKIKPLPELSAWFRQTRPAFGCFVYGADPETEKWEATAKPKDGSDRVMWVPKFLYFTKYKQAPPELQPIHGGDIYKMTIWWDRPFDPKLKRKHGTPSEFGVFVSKDGKDVIVLRVIDTKYVKVYSKRKHEEFRVPQRLWHIPSQYEEWAKEHGLDAQYMLAKLFIDSVHTLELAQGSIVRVAATKNDVTAVFSVNIKRMGYFFQDRDYRLTESGTRKHIFHMVRPHKRKDGTYIRFHFRGEREFTWAGYDVAITVPGRDHFMLDEFDVGTVDEYWVKKGDRMVNMPEVGKRLADNIKKGLGAHRP